MTPLRLGTEFSVIFLYEQEELEHFIQVNTLNIPGCSNIHTTNTLAYFVLSTLRSFRTLPFQFLCRRHTKSHRILNWLSLCKVRRIVLLFAVSLVNTYCIKLYEQRRNGK